MSPFHVMRRFLPPVVAFSVAAMACVLYWFWLGRPVPLPDLPGGRFQCLSYSPYDGGASPLEGKEFDVPRPVIAADIELLKSATDCVRTYAAVGVQGDVTRIAQERGMKVFQGIWVSDDREDSQKEIDAAVALTRLYPDTVKGLFVGNEVLLRREMTGASLAQIVSEVKAATGKPVLYADVPHFWKKYPEVAHAVDVIAVHILPYWDDPEPVSIEEVQDHIAAILAEMRAIFPEKPIMIGEIGWPSAGRARGAAIPSRVNQARFVREFAARAAATGLAYNMIEAIDQPWKQAPEGTVGGYWGIFDVDRNLKFPLTGPVREWPNWQGALAATLILMAAFFVYGLVSRRMAALHHWFALAALALVTSVSLVQLAEIVAVTSLTPLGWLAGAGMAAFTAAGAVLMVAAVEARVAPGSAPLPEVVAAVRGRVPWTAPRAIGAFYWGTAVPVAMLSVAIGFDGRHRDLPSWGLWIAGLSVLLLVRGGSDGRARREEAWLTFILAVSAFLSFDGWRNLEMFLWMATVLLFAAPGWRAVAAEARYLVSGAVERGGAQEREHHGDRA